MKLAWKLINFLQAVFTCAWSAIWIVAALIVRVVTGDVRVPLAMARRIWAPGLLWAGAQRLEVEGLERVDFTRPHCFAVNHQSIWDIVVTFRILPVPLLFVLKEELLKVPFLGWYVAAMGMVRIPRDHRRKSFAKLDEGRRRVAEGKSLLLFPEGTRSRDGRVGPFKAGTFVPALDAGVPVVPIALDGTGRNLPRGTFRVRPGTVRVRIGHPIPTVGMERDDRRALARQARDQVVAMWREIAPEPGPEPPFKAPAEARRLTDLDWRSWTPDDLATLLFVVQDGRILLIRKKRGLGAGKINGPGGRLDPGETPSEGAVREVEEELRVTATGVREVGELRFQFVDGYALHVHVFKADGYRGEVQETDEAAPVWCDLDNIPYAEMWADDRLWLPLMVSEEPFSGRFLFDGDAMLDHHVCLVAERTAVAGAGESADTMAS